MKLHRKTYRELCLIHGALATIEVLEGLGPTQARHLVMVRRRLDRLEAQQWIDFERTGIVENMHARIRACSRATLRRGGP